MTAGLGGKPAELTSERAQLLHGQVRAKPEGAGLHRWSDYLSNAPLDEQATLRTGPLSSDRGR